MKFRLLGLLYITLSCQLLALSKPALATNNFKLQNGNFKLQNGDLLFQDLNCGSFCDGVNNATYGYQNTYVSHVAMVIRSESNPLLIEAVSRGVVTTPLSEFLRRSLDENNQPRVMVGRLKLPYSELIPKAISYARAQLGKPYNSSFVAAGGRAFYCSELLEYTFTRANHDRAVFNIRPMSFSNSGDSSKSAAIAPEWQQYFAQLGSRVPQGLPGSNPGEISRESSIQIIHFYGSLRKKTPAQPS